MDYNLYYFVVPINVDLLHQSHVWLWKTVIPQYLKFSLCLLALRMHVNFKIRQSFFFLFLYSVQRLRGFYEMLPQLKFFFKESSSDFHVSINFKKRNFFDWSWSNLHTFCRNLNCRNFDLAIRNVTCQNLRFYHSLLHEMWCNNVNFVHGQTKSCAM